MSGIHDESDNHLIPDHHDAVVSRCTGQTATVGPMAFTNNVQARLLWDSDWDLNVNGNVLDYFGSSTEEEGTYGRQLPSETN